MALSGFSRDILRVLDEETRPLSCEEIAVILTQEKDSRIVPGRVRPYLEHALGEYVERESPDKWSITSPYHGRFAPSKRSASTDGDSGSDTIDGSQGDVTEDEIGELIVAVLTEAQSPLEVEKIAERIRATGHSLDEPGLLKTWINRKLRFALSSRVEKNGDFQWSLVGKSQGKAANRGDEEDLADEKEKPLQSRFAETHDGTYHGPEDLDEGKFLSALYEIDPQIQGQVSAETSRGSDAIEAALDQVSPTLAKEHAEKIRKGSPGLLPEKVVKFVRKKTERAGRRDSDTQSIEKKGEQQKHQNIEDSRSIRLEERLSFLQKDILGVIDQGGGHLSVEAILTKLDKERGRELSFNKVLNQLRYQLNEFVERGESGWTVFPSFSGRYSSDDDLSEENEDASEQSSQCDNKEDVFDSENDFDRLSRQIFQILDESDTPLKARAIAEEIRDGTGGVLSNEVNDTKKAVNQRLYGELSSFVEQNEDYQWEIVLYGSAVERAIEGDVSKNRGQSVDGLIDQAVEESINDGGCPTPTGLSDEISERLELAKRIAFLLDFVPEPLTASRITSIISSQGREVTQKGVEHCLESVLAPRVQKRESGYCLQKAREDESVSVESKPFPDAESNDPVNQSVDEVTRASIAGRRYSYRFQKEELETTSLFVSRVRGGTVEIKLNSSHPGFEKMKHILNGEAKQETSEEQLRELIRLLIMAWTEVEGDLTDRRKELAEEIRDDWGRALRSLVREQEEK